MSYPEKLPSSANHNIKSFNFSFSQAAKAKDSIQTEYSAVDERISNIVDSDKFTISGYPVLKSIMMLSPTKSELKKIVKALDRLADLVEIHSELNSKLSFIKTIEKDPNWLACAFGDFSTEVEKDIESFFQNLD